MVDLAKNHFRSWMISFKATGGTRESDAIELLSTKQIMLNMLSNDRIVVAFEETLEAINNLKLQEGFMNSDKK